jgi:hypothetical protein
MELGVLDRRSKEGNTKFLQVGLSSEIAAAIRKLPYRTVG